MSESFFDENRDSINQLNTKVADAIQSLKIDTSGNLSVGKCIKISGEINKAIKSIKSLKEALSQVESASRTGVYLAVTINTINSDEVKVVLSESQREVLENFCQDSETLETVVDLVDWVSDEVLVIIDKNNDGVITEDEVEDSCVDCCMSKNMFGQGPEGCECYQPTGCCSCCVSFSKFVSSCWSSIFFMCLGSKNKKAVRYQEAELNQV